MSLTGIPPRQKLLKPIRNRAHRIDVANLPCLSCGWKPHGEYLCQAAHVRLGWYRGGERPGDDRVVPLCLDCHTHQHSMSEDVFWNALDIDPIEVGLFLYAVTGDREKMRLIVVGAGHVGRVM